MFFRIYDKKTKDSFMKDAFDLNALRRNLKKEMGWDRIPNSVQIYPVSQMELEQLFQQYQAAMQQAEPTSDTPGGFQLINEAEGELEELTVKAEEVISEAAAL